MAKKKNKKRKKNKKKLKNVKKKIKKLKRKVKKLKKKRRKKNKRKSTRNNMMKLKYRNQLLKDELDETNKRIYERIVEQGGYVPKGLESKINIYWFQWFFTNYQREVTGETGVSYSDKDEDSIKFSGDWLDVPYPNAKKIWIRSLVGNFGEITDGEMDNLKFYEGKKIVTKKRMESGEVYVSVKNERDLTDDNYNWYELVQYMNDLLIEEGRLVDLGITGMSYKDKGIEFWYST